MFPLLLIKLWPSYSILNFIPEVNKTVGAISKNDASFNLIITKILTKKRQNYNSYSI
jgi:hypothetical protein